MSKKVDGVYESVYAPFLTNNAVAQKTKVKRMYTRILTEIAVNRFTWTGMPDSVDLRFLEMTLLFQGLSVFYYDTEYDRYMALRAASLGKINMYDNPTTFRVMGNSMVHKTLTPKECVPIWCNYLRIPDLDIIQVYADRFAEMDRTITINVLQQRKPYIITVPEEQRLTYLNVMKNVQDGEMAIFGTNSLDINSAIATLDTRIDKDQILNTITAKQKYWNECMTFLGINNSNQDKKERLVSNEVEANDDQIAATRGVALKSRAEAVERINKMYDLSVEVSWNSDVTFSAEMPNFTVGTESGGVRRVF